MKKIKLLMPILGVASIASVAVPLTSCSCNNAVTLASIAIKTEATKKDFIVGDTFSSAGLVITATYSDGTTKSVNSGESGLSTDYDTKTFAEADVGNDKEVTVSYKENDVTKTTTYKINVTNPTVETITLTYQTFNWYDNDHTQVTFVPNVIYKLYIGAIHQEEGEEDWGVNRMFLSNSSATEAYPFIFIENSAKNNGEILENARYVEQGHAGYVDFGVSGIQSGSVEVSFKVETETPAYPTIYRAD